MTRTYSPLDRWLIAAQELMAGPERVADGPVAPTPALRLPDTTMADDDRQHAAGLMRVNHAGEVAAQALYRGQAAVARDPALREHLLHAAEEERAHLHWCADRIDELGEKPSRLEPLWYAGSFAIGAAAGLVGDRISLGFVAETERQVSEHLSDHLRMLPREDERSRAIVAQMHADEQRHGADATQLGGIRLPKPVRGLMATVAFGMKRLAYRY